MESIFKYCTPNDTLYNLITIEQQQRMTRRLTQVELDSILSQLRMINKQLNAWDGHLDDFKRELGKVHKEAVDFNNNLQAATAIAGMFVSLTKLVHLGNKSASAVGKSLDAINKKAVKEVGTASADKALFLGDQLIPTDTAAKGEVKDIISKAISLALGPNPINAALTLTPIFANLYVFGSTNPTRWFDKFQKEGVDMMKGQKLTMIIRRDSLQTELRKAGYTPYQTLANPFNK